MMIEASHEACLVLQLLERCVVSVVRSRLRGGRSHLLLDGRSVGIHSIANVRGARLSTKQNSF